MPLLQPPTTEHEAASPAHPWTELPWTKPAVPAPSQVTRLQAEQGYPCVSLLMTTTPASRMVRDDVARLRELVTQATRRLKSEPLPGLQDLLLDELRRLTGHAAAGPTAAGIAIYASATTAEIVHLPIAVPDRVVIDPTFATRDLVRALHRAPRHVVLVLSTTEARLFIGVADTLQPALRSHFPLTVSSLRSATDRHTTSRQGRPDGSRPGLREADTAAFLRVVDQALGTHLRLHPAPLILVGPERLLATFRGLSRNLTRLAGSITGSHATAPLPELVHRTRPVLDAYLHSRQEEALQLLERRANTRRVATGIAAAWLAAKRERPEMLAVEDTLVQPARLSTDGDLLIPAEDAESPDVLDDAVDELIELVLHRGGWIALVQDGALAHHDRIALTLRN